MNFQLCKSWIPKEIDTVLSSQLNKKNNNNKNFVLLRRHFFFFGCKTICTSDIRQNLVANIKKRQKVDGFTGKLITRSIDFYFFFVETRNKN